MTTSSTSTLSWLDSSEQERRAIMELVSALNEPGTLDELGIGSIRDTFSDKLFPGTSTIQTRARYFLFVPWILRSIEDRAPRNALVIAQQLQLQLCEALAKAHGANEGVIGREAGAALQRWPISIYWLGLERWGIRRFSGSIASYFASLRRPTPWLSRFQANEEEIEGRRDEAPDEVRGNWARLPECPPGFPSTATFALTAEEAHFLRDRIVYSHRNSYLAHIVQTDGIEETEGDFPWEHPASQSATGSLWAWIEDGRLFGLVHQGAALLYNLMLAEFLEDEQGIESHAAALGAWSETIAAAEPELASWDREAMWNRLSAANPRLRRRTREFTERWHVIATGEHGTPLRADAEARRLIKEREHSLKGPRSRLTYAEARDYRGGYPTSARLEYRWSQVRRITADILEGLRA